MTASESYGDSPPNGLWAGSAWPKPKPGTADPDAPIAEGMTARVVRERRAARTRAPQTAMGDQLEAAGRRAARAAKAKAVGEGLG